jgi:hypothetical protein
VRLAHRLQLGLDVAQLGQAGLERVGRFERGELDALLLGRRVAVRPRKYVATRISRCDWLSVRSASATVIVRNTRSVLSASANAVRSRSYVSAGRACSLRCSSMAIRRATVTSHGRSEPWPWVPSRCALRHARSSVSCTMSSARCRSPPVSRITNISSGPACSA